ncbi:phosphatidate phosphatase PAH2-like [Cynara cardunculus var. scolymus]|uniref:phosphatidate phosphatase PAH2-like n=1 Tax=Cynara cardunculus var. scolymus TaxID=59895 RepID=UPI000D625BCF|nr:phosphatidate phosphatase PAH2-like [Cynara cardunculus var. scolymus]
MYAVGRLSSYITRGVSTVSGPFHPFGGAIDIVVVQHEDGSLKSSPWYVRFGKFQGVLKAKERVVDINVNGVEAGFHMYLNPRGEAYFLREDVDPEEILGEPDREGRRLRPIKSKSLDINFDQCNSLIDVNDSKSFSRNLGFVFSRKARSDNEEDDLSVGRRNSRESAEIAADLLEMKWSTTLPSETNNRNDGRVNQDDGEITSGKLEASLVLHEEHFVNNLEDNEGNTKVAKEVDKVIVANADSDGNVEIYEGDLGSLENGETLKVGSDGSNGPETAEEPSKAVEESYTEVACIRQGDVSEEVNVVEVSVCRAEDDKGTSDANETDKIKSPLKSNGEFQDGSNASLLEPPERVVEEQFTFSDLDDRNSSANHLEQETQPPSTSEVNHGSDSSPCTFHKEIKEDDMEGPKGNIRRFPSDADIVKNCQLTEEETGTQAKSLPNMWSQFDEFNPNNLDASSYYCLDSKRKFSKWDILRKDASRIIKEGDKQLSDSQSADTKSKNLKDGSNAGGNPSNIHDGTDKSWSLWPFKRSRSKKFSHKEHDCKKDSDFDCASEVDGEKDPLSKSHKMHRELTPTPEQLESLNLTEGKNTVTFKFSTPVLDARIFLWRWDSHIVISDVDGTITKSDVLGQFMPLVGRDWSHIGVTHLFSAIKENGYQILFLSARSISQADVTRQFLINLKQEGKALPEGPVVISPDGLFPSLFREVIRRAPHEFKISCLEDIRACFPADWNPFFAGFGNRDTDEFSYLKVGIPKGKIFIINPKGEVVVNRCIDPKSYSSLHTIVNGIFPPVCVHKEGYDLALVNDDASERPAAQ